MSLRPLVIALALGAGLAASQDGGVEPDVRAVLTRQLRLTSKDFAEVERGRVVAHDLPSRAPGEVAVVGVTRVRAAKAAFFSRVRDITRFKSGPDILQIGRFSDPPTLDDLAALSVDEDDFDVRSCRVGDCGIRLSSDVIRRLSSEVDVKAADAQARGAQFFKRVLLELVTAYAAGDADHMAQYDDGRKPIRPRDALDGIVANMPELGALLPALPGHVRRFRANPLPDAESFLYWSKEKFGIAPFITVTHVTLVCRSAATCLMTTRDVYSSRYLDASVALAIATDVGAGDAFDLVYENRSRANALKGALGGLRRSLTERRARGGLAESLKTIKTQLEQATLR